MSVFLSADVNAKYDFLLRLVPKAIKNMFTLLTNIILYAIMWHIIFKKETVQRKEVPFMPAFNNYTNTKFIRIYGTGNRIC